MIRNRSFTIKDKIQSALGRLAKGGFFFARIKMRSNSHTDGMKRIKVYEVEGKTRDERETFAPNTVPNNETRGAGM